LGKNFAVLIGELLESFFQPLAGPLPAFGHHLDFDVSGHHEPASLGRNEPASVIDVTSHFAFKNLPVTLCYGAS